jgi:hypothetical protein
VTNGNIISGLIKTLRNEKTKVLGWGPDISKRRENGFEKKFGILCMQNVIDTSLFYTWVLPDI